MVSCLLILLIIIFLGIIFRGSGCRYFKHDCPCYNENYIISLLELKPGQVNQELLKIVCVFGGMHTVCGYYSVYSDPPSPQPVVQVLAPHQSSAAALILILLLEFLLQSLTDSQK